MEVRTSTGNELIIFGWKNNKSVYVAWNCDSRKPISTVQNGTPKVKFQSCNHF